MQPTAHLFCRHCWAHICHRSMAQGSYFWVRDRCWKLSWGWGRSVNCACMALIHTKDSQAGHSKQVLEKHIRNDVNWSILLHQQYPATILIKHEYFQPKWAQINLKSPMGQFQRIWREKAIFDNPSQRDYYKLSKLKVQFREQSTACLAQSHPPTDQKQKARNRHVNCKLVFLLLTNANKHYSQYSERWDATWADSELKRWQRWYQLKGS